MSAIVRGTPGPIEQARKYSGGPYRADTTIQTFKGPKADILALVPGLKLVGYEWSIEEGPGPNAVLTVNAPNLGDFVDTWELLPAEVEKDVLEADRAVINGLSEANRRKIRKWILNPVQDESPVFDGTSAADANAIYQLMLSGMRAVWEFAPVLRRTRTVASGYATAASTANVKRLISTTSLIPLEGVPAGFLITLNGSPYTDFSTRDNKAYAWYKKPATLQVGALSRIQIQQEWAFGLWPMLVYGDVI